MLKMKSTDNYAGVTISGDFNDLEAWCLSQDHYWWI